jgi:hypothetical protein
MLLDPGTDQISPPSLAAIKRYLDFGTDVTVKDEDGRTAYDTGISVNSLKFEITSTNSK